MAGRLLCRRSFSFVLTGFTGFTGLDYESSGDSLCHPLQGGMLVVGLQWVTLRSPPAIL